MMPGPSLESSDNGTDDCPDSGFEFNDYQNFWNSALGVTTMTTNLVFCFLTTLLAVSLKTFSTTNSQKYYFIFLKNFPLLLRAEFQEIYGLSVALSDIWYVLL